MIKDLKVTRGTVVRTIMTILVLVNLILKACGIEVINIDESSISAVIENLISIGVIVLGFWKNNSFTTEAKNADFCLAKLRAFDTDDTDSVFEDRG